MKVRNKIFSCIILSQLWGIIYSDPGAVSERIVHGWVVIVSLQHKVRGSTPLLAWVQDKRNKKFNIIIGLQ